MIGKASVITHSANAVRYSADKDMAEIVKVNNCSLLYYENTSCQYASYEAGMAL